MNDFVSKDLGSFVKVLPYDKNIYQVKEKIQNNTICYEAINTKTQLTITYTNKSLFQSHFRKREQFLC